MRRIIILDLGVHICTHVCTYKYAYTISMYIYHKNISPEPGGSFHHIYYTHAIISYLYRAGSFQRYATYPYYIHDVCVMVFKGGSFQNYVYSV